VLQARALHPLEREREACALRAGQREGPEPEQAGRSEQRAQHTLLALTRAFGRELDRVVLAHPLIIVAHRPISARASAS
jgi:hypothetical protein